MRKSHDTIKRGLEKRSACSEMHNTGGEKSAELDSKPELSPSPA